MYNSHFVCNDAKKKTSIKVLHMPAYKRLECAILPGELAHVIGERHNILVLDTVLPHLRELERHELKHLLNTHLSELDLLVEHSREHVRHVLAGKLLWSANLVDFLAVLSLVIARQAHRCAFTQVFGVHHGQVFVGREIHRLLLDFLELGQQVLHEHAP
jgi:hypothetical protein